jgi:hypothetical protein
LGVVEVGLEQWEQLVGEVPNGYCGMGGTGVSCPVGAA